MRKEIIISGMTCNNCIHHIKEALNEVDGIRVLTVSIGKALVEVENFITNSLIENVIEDTGYITEKIN